MTFYEATYPFPLGGHPNGRYRQATSQASGGSNFQSSTADLGAPISQAYAQAYISVAATSEPGSTIEDAGIRAGEITAYRAWRLQDGLLHSMFANFIWFPGVIERAHKVDEHWGTGLHAFKTLAWGKKEYTYADVWGEVALWGDVIEHERGYRAEFAVVRKIISVSPDFPILRIRKRVLQRRYCKPIES